MTQNRTIPHREHPYLEGLSLLGLEGRADYVLGHKIAIVVVAFGEEKSCIVGFRVELLVEGLSWFFWMNFPRIKIRLALIIFANLFYYLTYFYYY